MAKKEFSYRGKSLEDLQKMSLKELAELFPSRQRRTIKRGFTDAEKILYKNIQAGKKNIETHCREFIVIPSMVGMTIRIHNGKKFVEVQIMPEMISHALGEFAPTRNRVAHSAPGIGATRSSAALSVK